MSSSPTATSRPSADRAAAAASAGRNGRARPPERLPSSRADFMSLYLSMRREAAWHGAADSCGEDSLAEMRYLQGDEEIFDDLNWHVNEARVLREKLAKQPWWEKPFRAEQGRIGYMQQVSMSEMVTHLQIQREAICRLRQEVAGLHRLVAQSNTSLT